MLSPQGVSRASVPPMHYRWLFKGSKHWRQQERGGRWPQHTAVGTSHPNDAHERRQHLILRESRAASAATGYLSLLSVFYMRSGDALKGKKLPNVRLFITFLSRRRRPPLMGYVHVGTKDSDEDAVGLSFKGLSVVWLSEAVCCYARSLNCMFRGTQASRSHVM